MEKKIVIVGGGQASFSCASRLRDLGFEDEIVILCEEAMYPYQRPPLSKKFLIGQFPEERLLFRKYEYFEEKKINVLLNKKALRIDRQENKVYLETGEIVQYSKLVLATGSRAKKNPILENDKYRNVFYLRNLSDAKTIQHFLIPRKKILVVGGGYLGLEVAAICSSVGIKTTLVEGKDRILKRVAGNPTASHLRKMFISNGVRIIESDTIEKVSSVGKEISVVTLNSGKKIDVDFLLVATGGYPEVTLAKSCGLTIDDGIKVNKNLQTIDPEIYAAGDCVSFIFDKKYIRLESVGNAIDQGQVVAMNIIGKKMSYKAKPWFWTEQFDLKLQIAGLCDGYTEIIERKINEKISFWYFKNDKLIAVDSFNDPKSYMIGKRLIEGNKSPKKGLLSDINFDLKDFLNF